MKRGIFYDVSSAPPYGREIIIFNSDIAFKLRKEDDSSFNSGANGEVGITAQDYALVPVKCSCPHSSGVKPRRQIHGLGDCCLRNIGTSSNVRHMEKRTCYSKDS